MSINRIVLEFNDKLVFLNLDNNKLYIPWGHLENADEKYITVFKDIKFLPMSYVKDFHKDDKAMTTKLEALEIKLLNIIHKKLEKEYGNEKDT